eukprot:5161520-Amphidinium_carterae.1
MSAIAVRGRWSNTRTARVYINDGLSLIAELAPAPPLQRRLESLARSYCSSYRPGPGGCG